jgi:hypothetical protein
MRLVARPDASDINKLRRGSHMKTAGDEMDRAYDDVYERHAKQLEVDHWGEFVAMTRDGRFEIGTDMDEVAHRALRSFGPGLFLYKIGERAVGRIR